MWARLWHDKMAFSISDHRARALVPCMAPVPCVCSALASTWPYIYPGGPSRPLSAPSFGAQTWSPFIRCNYREKLYFYTNPLYLFKKKSQYFSSISYDVTWHEVIYLSRYIVLMQIYVLFHCVYTLFIRDSNFLFCLFCFLSSLLSLYRLMYSVPCSLC